MKAVTRKKLWLKMKQVFPQCIPRLFFGPRLGGKSDHVALKNGPCSSGLLDTGWLKGFCMGVLI